MLHSCQACDWWRVYASTDVIFVNTYKTSSATMVLLVSYSQVLYVILKVHTPLCTSSIPFNLLILFYNKLHSLQAAYAQVKPVGQPLIQFIFLLLHLTKHGLFYLWQGVGFLFDCVSGFKTKLNIITGLIILNYLLQQSCSMN